jgi:MFS family permease
MLVSTPVSLSSIPLVLSTGPTQRSRRRRGSACASCSRSRRPGWSATTLANGACFGIGAVYGRAIGLSVRDITSLFMSLILLGGMLLQWLIGHPSDAWDRRQVLTAVTLLAAGFALLATASPDHASAARLAWVAVWASPASGYSRQNGFSASAQASARVKPMSRSM